MSRRPTGGWAPGTMPSGTMTWLWYMPAAFALAAWMLPMLEYLLSGWRIGRLTSAAPDGSAALPSVSVIVAARDESATVEPAMRSLLALDYPDLQVVAVDDRSSDTTGAVLDGLADADPRLTVEHVLSLPSGWLGKNHALHAGSLRATGDWLLFTDADVVFEPAALRQGIRYAEERGLDHLAVFPDMVLHGYWETAVLWFWSLMFIINTRPWKVPDPRDRAHVGVGAFNLIRAGLYRKMGGHAALPLDVLDDMKVGKLAKRAGGRTDSAAADGQLRVRWVEGVRGMVLGLTKNMFAGLGFRPAQTLLACAAVLVMGCWPAFGLFLGPWPARLVCAAALAVMTWSASRSPLVRAPALLFVPAFPVGALVFVYIVMRSMLLTYRQGGIVWRGTLYRLAELRRGIV